MGGSVFKPEGLSTPRMPPKVYNSVLAHTEELLRAHFKLVGHAIEAPAKSSHGDIDILVAEPFDRNVAASRDIGHFLADLLKAEKWKKMRGTSTYHFALVWPKEFEDQLVIERETKLVPSGDGSGQEETDEPFSDQKEQNTTSMNGNINPNSFTMDAARISSTTIDGSASPSLPMPLSSTQKYIQVDISLMPNPHYFLWHTFMQAHGDLWQMLGGVLRRFGISLTSKGLFLKIAEVEMHNKEQSKVLMTNDPDTVLDFVGLDRERYWQAFGSWEEMMDYVASCRLHDPGRWKHWTKPDEDEGEAEIKEEIGTGAGSLKSNDRRRAAKRPLFAYWIEQYLPANVDRPPGKSAFLTREAVVEDAKEYFGVGFATSFEERKKKMVRQIGVDKLWADIRKSLPIEGTEIGYVMKGMKREIAGRREEQPAQLERLDGSDEVRMAFEAGRFDDVLKWATLNWNEIGQRQKRLDQEISRVHLLEKVNRDAQRGKGRRS
ncbi:uncharacterized protein Z520_10264 [Fonsecaea multimorphosa CBS 102226]|uniref:Uncharacterized protein n=1 Tax=Fonsecaea multimorphosa CBS 102226 TaxID=1442371 RepID=A0A0D2JL12_9EURO|nr:uncharacterized protein Z520_10264 [Fonsecaea multimorphosa CBS 102226]KIX93927.1 hypothetical protein Z520_10264 [Fonsecaea multimorphosa CBS 102226]OAL19276.1 hypothetical protein AYO22_09820 [Fonsecaea multimorphosa]